MPHLTIDEKQTYFRIDLKNKLCNSIKNLFAGKIYHIQVKNKNSNDRILLIYRAQNQKIVITRYSAYSRKYYWFKDQISLPLALTIGNLFLLKWKIRKYKKNWKSSSCIKNFPNKFYSYLFLSVLVSSFLFYNLSNQYVLLLAVGFTTIHRAKFLFSVCFIKKSNYFLYKYGIKSKLIELPTDLIALPGLFAAFKYTNFTYIWLVYFILSIIFIFLTVIFLKISPPVYKQNRATITILIKKSIIKIMILIFWVYSWIEYSNLA